MRILFASDHAGFAMKSELSAFATQLGHDVVDLGPEGPTRVDYPDFAKKLAKEIEADSQARGVLVCGTGIGISIAANRNVHVRAALCTDVTMARLTRLHNDANVIAFGERVMGIEVAKEALEAFLVTEFEGGRHTARVEKLAAL